VLYAHSQNSKTERYICILENSAQMLLADAGLPPEFLSDAVLTVQYLCNHSPTSTLSVPLTLYEVLKKKPDLLHLHIWGCQCFPLIPPERRIKGLLILVDLPLITRYEYNSHFHHIQTLKISVSHH